MKKRIKLTEISLQSFVTEASNTKEIKGGIIETEWCSQAGPCVKPY
ncbi:pinensin family lanthipeptide [Roseivirga sp. BDSF3-8]